MAKGERKDGQEKNELEEKKETKTKKNTSNEVFNFQRILLTGCFACSALIRGLAKKKGDCSEANDNLSITRRSQRGTAFVRMYSLFSVPATDFRRRDACCCSFLLIPIPGG